ncbi:hypothetical protein BK125_18600 [Paenibacillus odorifer]|uniref:Uncharacterized protein n=1 Tax=Paenibacillus odorifer TaxID=189426 RepID=A0ABX3GCE7_9BACL|nr:hypothetical protein [Paenibacillus odorifer]OMC76495.1 hypothetical protein BK125_18600 [Paenibacillus odorifer]OMC97553.1 hypothetical protein BSO21_33355 [Paenibacillus odorifer]
MTEQQIRSFGQALAERFKQVGDERLVAERRFRESLYSPASIRFEVLELERKRDIAQAAFDSWKEVTENLPSEIQNAFKEHYQKINPMEAI